MVSVREMLANAVCHRDYSDATRSIHLRVFQDRIEILSPGTWMGATALTGQMPLGSLRSESIARNPTLARLLAWIKSVEREGSGLSRAIADCAHKEAPEPCVEERDGFVKVTVFPSKTFDRVSKGEGPRLSLKSPEIIKATEREQVAYVLSKSSDADKLDAIRRYAAQDCRSAYRVLRQFSGISSDATLQVLREVAGWDGEDLKTLVSGWIGLGRTREDVLEQIMTWLGSSADHRTLAFSYYAIVEQDLPIGRDDFFRACWRPAPADFRLDTVRIPGNGGSACFTMGGGQTSAPGEELPAHEVELTPY